MSHFTVLVVCPPDTNQENVNECLLWALDPYYEQVEPDSPYAVFKDETEEYREQYEKETQEYIVMPDGRLCLPWDDEFEVPDPNIPGFCSHKVPEHLERRQVPFKETYKTFEEFVQQWHDRPYDEKEGGFGYYHNPNAKWDWWQLGGRYEGWLTVKAGTERDTLIFGGPGVFGHDKNAYVRPDGRFGCDGCRKADLDFDCERERNIASVKERWERMVAEGHENSADLRKFKYGFELEDTFESVMAQAEHENPFLTFAILLDGHWYEKGHMGAFGIVNGSKSQISGWCGEVNDLWNKIPYDAVVVVVDCHI
jgi:hypothetical protein